MKKYLLYALTLLALTRSPLRAQTQPAATPANPSAESSRWSLSLSAGPSIPTGKFAAKNRLNSESGNARVGPGAELALTRWLNRSFGLTAVAAGQINSIGVYTTLPNPGSGSGTIQNDPWKIARFLVGGTFRQPLSAGLSLEVRALAGVLKTTIPGYTYHFSSVSGLGTSQSTGSISGYSLPLTFAYETGAALKWQLPGRFFLRMDAAYAHANTNLHKDFTIMVNGQVQGTGTIERKQPIGVLQLYIGAGIQL